MRTVEPVKRTLFCSGNSESHVVVSFVGVKTVSVSGTVKRCVKRPASAPAYPLASSFRSCVSFKGKGGFVVSHPVPCKLQHISAHVKNAASVGIAASRFGRGIFLPRSACRSHSSCGICIVSIPTNFFFWNGSVFVPLFVYLPAYKKTCLKAGGSFSCCVFPFSFGRKAVSVFFP